jgi:protein-S-isoprenylcysteine O-methyltransferase
MAGFGAMELFLRRGAEAKRLRPTAADRGTTVAIVAAYALAVLAVSATGLLPRIALGATVAWIGVGVGTLGFMLRVWAMRVLGRFYTRTLLTTADQKVVTSGPYRYVRHPGYLGALAVWLGASASSGNLLVVIAVAVLLLFAYAYRIRVEERMLMDALGEPYAEYRRRSWRLLPLVF